MKLIDAIVALDALDEESTIYVVEPWTKDSQAVVASEVEEDESGGIPPEARQVGAEYFLEVFIARPFLEDWARTLDAVPTAEERCARLIQYAVDGA